jgi:hypothetical protein
MDQSHVPRERAHAKSLAIVLSYHQPVDLLTGQVIDTAKALAWTNAREFHHFFPRNHLKQHGYQNSNFINCLANIVMLTSASNKEITMRAPSDYLKDVQEAAGADLEKWLQSNLVSERAYEAALEDDFEIFLRERRTSIHEAILDLADWD